MAAHRGGKPRIYKKPGRGHRAMQKEWWLRQRREGLVNSNSGSWVQPNSTTIRDKMSGIAKGLNLW